MNIPHNRRSIRLSGYDYTQSGAYFVTLVTQGRENRFGQILAGEVLLSAMGRMIRDEWASLPARFTNITLDEYILMPNHLHAIIMIGMGGRGEASALNTQIDHGPVGRMLRAHRSGCRPSKISTTYTHPKGTDPGSLGAIIQISNRFRPAKSIHRPEHPVPPSGSATTTNTSSARSLTSSVSVPISSPIPSPGIRTPKTQLYLHDNVA